MIEKLGISGLIIAVVLLIAGVVGWVLNIIKIVSCDWNISAEEVLRVVGIFVAPLGAILGWFGHF